MSTSLQDSCEAIVTQTMRLENSFLQQVVVSNPADRIPENCDAVVVEALEKCWGSGKSELVSGGEGVEAIACLPVWKSNELRNVIAFVLAKHHPPLCGVIEIWCPTGQYQDLALSRGYFGELERFQNVSSFVRFERGSGLPGQAWDLGQTVIHDDLKNHPGFLRAAGAAADSLETAVGIPVLSDAVVEALVVISSCTSPFARALEVWTPSEGMFALKDTAVASADKSTRQELGKACSPKSLVNVVVSLERAVLSSDDRFLSPFPGSQAVLAFPTFVGRALTCITVMVF